MHTHTHYYYAPPPAGGSCRTGKLGEEGEGVVWSPEALEALRHAAEAHVCAVFQAAGQLAGGEDLAPADLQAAAAQGV